MQVEASVRLDTILHTALNRTPQFASPFYERYREVDLALAFKYCLQNYGDRGEYLQLEQVTVIRT